MKKRVSFLLLVSLYWTPCVSQSYYSKMVDLFSSWEVAGAILNFDTLHKNLLFIGDFVNPVDPNRDSLKYNHIYTCLLDSNAAVKNTWVLGKAGYDYRCMLSKIMIGNKPSFVYIVDTPQRKQYYLIQPDSLGNPVSVMPIKCSSTTLLVTLIHSFDSKIYLWGVESNSGIAPLVLLCLDSAGNQLWYKKYTGKRYWAFNVVSDKTGNFLLAGVATRGNGIYDTSFGWFSKMDTSGNFIWDKAMDGHDVFWTDYTWISQANGEYYLMGGNRPSGPSGIQDTYAYIAQIDSGGKVRWRNNFLYTDSDRVCGAGRAFAYRNNHIYATVDYQTHDGWADYTQYIGLVKLDIQGKLKWKRLFKKWYQENRAWDMIATPDGFIICGSGKDTTHTTGHQDAWIIKTDTNGCVVPGCNIKDGLVQITNPEAFVNVYPNPATDELNIEVTDERAKLKNVFVYDAKGELSETKAVAQQPANSILNISTRSYAAGIYYVVIELEKGERAVKKVMIQR